MTNWRRDQLPGPGPAEPAVHRPRTPLSFRRGFSALSGEFLGEFLLIVVGQRGLENGAAEGLHGAGELVLGDLRGHDDYRGVAGLEQVLHTAAELGVDARLVQLAHEDADRAAEQ